MEKKQIAIIGAAISGLIACKYTFSKGFHPIVFEPQCSIEEYGPKFQSLKSYKHQDQCINSQIFLGHLRSLKNFQATIKFWVYVQSYACHFDLFKQIEYNIKVVGIEFEGHSDEEMRSSKL